MSDQPEQLVRPHVEALDQIIGVPFRVLDDGFVRLIDYMGSDQAIVQAARVSYGIGTKRVHEDRGLIRYLLRNTHTTPFEMCEIKLHVRVPMDCWRQWIRHRTANVNEYSTRYSIAIDATQRTLPDAWRAQSSSNRQGSTGTIDTELGQQLSDRELMLQKLAREIYEERIAANVAREQARKDLLLSTYTEAYWKIDLHNLFHFLKLRMDSHAQAEIRSYAEVIGREIVARWCPASWEAFLDYNAGMLSLSRTESELIALLISRQLDAASTLAQECGWIGADGVALSPHRERNEFEMKLSRLGLVAPWEPNSRPG